MRPVLFMRAGYGVRAAGLTKKTTGRPFTFIRGILLAGILTTRPFFQTTIGSPLRRCSSIVFATAMCSAFSAF